jgi:hypothetical protein
MRNPRSGHLHLIECGEAHGNMYTVYIFIVMVALAVFLGTVIFLLSAMLVAIRAGAEALGDALTGFVRKLVSPPWRRPEVPAVHTASYGPTARK